MKGEEFVTFEQPVADRQPEHCTMLPFTRNLFDPMDFTPVVFDKLPGNKQRRTTPAFELALAVLFTSGIQHYAEIPSGMAKVPPYVRDLMQTIPSVWEDFRFIDGYPGKFVILARKSGNHWYLAGINGEPKEKSLTLDLSFLPATATAESITDGTKTALQEPREPRP
uniref:Glyco_hydro_97 n=1 Tax=uncultured Rhodothermus sp. TaxID=246141 RepID=A0A060CQY5_9BACT|nr:Glyco_hydro_97 [uncultured Rhodothermus sp.]